MSADGGRVAFLRSSGPEDPVNALWVLDAASGVERLAADPRRLSGSPAGGGVRSEVPSEERARRERVRETAAGIVSFDADPALATAVFALDGALWRADLDTGETALPPARRGAFDPRLAPGGERVAYVCGSSLRVTGAQGDREVIGEPGPDVSWGSAEFAAAEEMGRTRGHWWSPDGGRLLAARADTSPVKRWWISAPNAPDKAPSAIRYPAAGTANAVVGLAVFDVSSREPSGSDRGQGSGGAQGSDRARGSGGEARVGEGASDAGPAPPDGAPSRVEVAWDAEGWEYLASVLWSAEGLLLTVQSRDQRTLAVLDADPATGACSMRYTVTDDAWVELVPGAPRLAGGRLVTVEDRGPARRLCADGEALTPDRVQVRRVEHADESGVIVTASVDPAAVRVARVGWDGALEWLTSGSGVAGAAVGGPAVVLQRRSLDWTGLRCTVHTAGGDAAGGGVAGGDAAGGGVAGGDAAGGGAAHRIASLAADPGLDLSVRIVGLGPRRLKAAIVMPARARADGPLPVLLDPYGGPHAQRVLNSRSLYHTPQWFAEQGFAVVVIDGRGTPGRGPAFERAVRGNLADPVLEDQITGLRAAARLEPRLDLSRVAIRGWSFGGYLAALAVLRRPDVFGAAIAGAPVTDWRLYDTHYTERYLGHPDEEPENYERTELVRLAPRLRRPLMLIHGLSDDNVVAAHTLRLSQALLEGGRLHTVLPLSGVTHMTAQDPAAEHLLPLQLRFLRSALGASDSL